MNINKIQNISSYLTKSKPAAFSNKKPDFNVFQNNTTLMYGFDLNQSQINYTALSKIFLKTELKKKLESIVNKDGSFKLRNSDISMILNSENDISQIDEVLNMINDRGIELERDEFVNYFSREDFDFEFEKDKFLIIDEINKSEDYEFLRRIFSNDVSSIIKSVLKGTPVLSSEQYISNIVLLSKIQAFLKNKSKTNSLDNFEFKSVIQSVLSNSKVKPQDFDSLVESGLIDGFGEIFSLNYLLLSNVDENLDFSKRIKLIKQIKEKTNLLDDLNLYCKNLRALLEADFDNDCEISKKNFEFLKKNEGFFKNAQFIDKVKLTASKREFDTDAQEFLNFLSDKLNKIKGINPINLLLIEKADYKNLAVILDEIIKNNLDEFFAADFISDLEKYGEEQIMLSIKKAQTLKNYPNVLNNVNLCFNNIADYFNLDDSNIEESEKRMKALDEFIKNNPKIIKKIPIFYKVNFIYNSLFAQDFDDLAINNKKRMKIAALIASKNSTFNLMNKLNLKQTLGMILTHDELSEKEYDNIEKNLVYLDELMKFFAHCAINVGFEINLSPMLYWLSSDCDLGVVLKKIKYLIEENKANLVEVVCNVDGFEILSDYGAFEIHKKYDKKAEIISVKKEFYGVKSDFNLKKSLIKEKGFNIETKELYNDKAKSYYPLNLKKEVKDKDNKTLYVEKFSPSALDGALEIKRTYPDGKVEIISHANITPEFSTIEKNLTSSDGTKTKINFKKDKNGNYESVYKIYSKDNKEILSDFKSRRVLDDNTILNIHNKKSYKIKYCGFKISIFDLNSNKEFVLDLEKLIKSNKEKHKLLSLFKQLDAWEIIFLLKNVNEINFVNKLSSGAHLSERMLNVGVQKFIFEHELGHIKDISFEAPIENDDYKISSLAGFHEIFDYEKENFKRNFSDFENGIVEYFLKPPSTDKKCEKPAAETLAEINAVLNSSIFQQQLLFRTQILQTNFPLTIAYLAEKFEEIE